MTWPYWIRYLPSGRGPWWLTVQREQDSIWIDVPANATTTCTPSVDSKCVMHCLLRHTPDVSSTLVGPLCLHNLFRNQQTHQKPTDSFFVEEREMLTEPTKNRTLSSRSRESSQSSLQKRCKHRQPIPKRTTLLLLREREMSPIPNEMPALKL
jgi:hypothetical protein